MTQELQLWQLRRPLFVDFVKNLLCEEFLEPDEVGINMCLILQNMTDFTVTALAAQNTREMEAHILQSKTHLFTLTY